MFQNIMFVTEDRRVGFRRHLLPNGYLFWTGELPVELHSRAVFDAIWETHPAEYHEICLHGRTVKTPRWQQAYGHDYQYSGRLNQALPLPALLKPFLSWSREVIDPRLNGLLLNWYDAALDHYIGRHRDSTKGIVPSTPIATISLGDPRTFRLRPCRSNGRVDFDAKDGSAFVMPYETNLGWTHEVPRTRRPGRRVSITIRAFEG